MSRTVGHYEIIEKIGKGGMGEVYRARDTRLDRDVALKMLPEETASDPERLRRFEREAKAVAALKHPNIVTIHSVEEVDGRNCLTMELVEGKTLSELIPEGGMPLERLFQLTIPIADALSAAHAKGITHRDLKPSNVMVDADGRVKVLDFGLAKLAAAPDGTEDKTVIDEDSVTAEGKVVGTVHYMSPEQAEAKPLDHRSDIFSLGVVLYEMATGKRPFSGDTPISTISAILRETPSSVTDIRSNMPRHLARVINRCLEKKPDKRFQTARDVVNELEGLQKEVESGDHDEVMSGTMSQSSLGIPRQKQRSMWPIAAGIVVVALAVTVYFAFFRGGPTEPARTVTTHPMTSLVGTESPGSWAPDGGFFAYSHSAMGPLDIFIMSSAGGDPIKLVESPYDDASPRWSPDNRWIAFISTRDQKAGIYLIPPLGGQIQKLVETNVPPLTNSVYATLGKNPWSANGATLVFAKRSDDTRMALWKIDLQTRQETKITTPPAGESDFLANVSLAGDKIIFCRSDGSKSQLLTMPFAGGEPKIMLEEPEGYLDATWTHDGKAVVYAPSSGGLWFVDAKSGRKRQLTTGEDESNPVMSSDGRLLYATFSHQTDLYIMDVDGTNAERLTFHTQNNFGPQISNDGTKIVYMSSRTGNGELWLIDRTSGTERQLTFREGYDGGPSWSPDDKQIVFGSEDEGAYGVWVLDVDGGVVRRLGDREIESGDALFAPDGSVIGFVSGTDEGQALFVIDPGGGEARKVLDNVASFNWYLDGNHIIYATAGGSQREMRVVNIETGEEAVLFDGPFRELAVAPDGSAVSYISSLSHFNMSVHILPLERPSSPGALPRPAGPPVRITHGEGEWHAHNGGWSPDSKQVIFTRDTDSGDIYLLEGAL